MSQPLLLILSTVLAELACWAELTEFVTNHVLANEHWYVYLTVMNGDGTTYHVWADSACAGPCFDDGSVFKTQGRYFLRELEVDERTFFK